MPRLYYFKKLARSVADDAIVHFCAYAPATDAEAATKLVHFRDTAIFHH